MNRYLYNRGFTLIELVVTVTIILVMTLLAIPAFNTYSANSEISAKAEEIQALLEKAYALSQSPPSGKSIIYFNIFGSQKKVVLSTDQLGANEVIDSITLPSNMFFDNPGKNYRCNFQSTEDASVCTITTDNPETTITTLTKKISSNDTSVSFNIVMDFANFKVTVNKL